jgi:hypothetical protein
MTLWRNGHRRRSRHAISAFPLQILEIPEIPMTKTHVSDETALNEWHRIILERDWERLPDILTDDVTYHNPAQSEPLRGKDALVGTLQIVFGIFEDFEYARRFGGVDGYGLEFRGRVGDAPFTGIDLIRFDTAGRITDLVVMIRPIGAVMKLGEEAARRMAQAQAEGE